MFWLVKVTKPSDKFIATFNIWPSAEHSGYFELHVQQDSIDTVHTYLYTYILYIYS
jgi:hypothetical protein